MKTKHLTLAALLLVPTPWAIAQPKESSPTPTPHFGLRGIEPSVRTEPTVETETANTNYPRPGTPLTPKATPKSTTTPPAARESATLPSPPAAPRTTARATASPRSIAGAGSTAISGAAASPVPSAPALPKNPVAAVREMKKRWAAATKEHDIATIESLLAADYIGITAAGNIVNKAGLLAELRKDKNIYEAVTNDRPDVRIHGSTAVVVGTTKQKGKDAAGNEFSYTYRWTDTWVERDGEWQCAASQSIRPSG